VVLPGRRLGVEGAHPASARRSFRSRPSWLGRDRVLGVEDRRGHRPAHAMISGIDAGKSTVAAARRRSRRRRCPVAANHDCPRRALLQRAARRGAPEVVADRGLATAVGDAHRGGRRQRVHDVVEAGVKASLAARHAVTSRARSGDRLHLGSSSASSSAPMPDMMKSPADWQHVDAVLGRRVGEVLQVEVTASGAPPSTSAGHGETTAALPCRCSPAEQRRDVVEVAPSCGVMVFCPRASLMPPGGPGFQPVDEGDAAARSGGAVGCPRRSGELPSAGARCARHPSDAARSPPSGGAEEEAVGQSRPRSPGRQPVARDRSSP